MLMTNTQLCAQSDVFIDKRELSQLFDAEASRFQARKEQTSGEVFVHRYNLVNFQSKYYYIT